MENIFDDDNIEANGNTESLNRLLEELRQSKGKHGGKKHGKKARRQRKAIEKAAAKAVAKAMRKAFKKANKMQKRARKQQKGARRQQNYEFSWGDFWTEIATTAIKTTPQAIDAWQRRKYLPPPTQPKYGRGKYLPAHVQCERRISSPNRLLTDGNKDDKD